MSYADAAAKGPKQTPEEVITEYYIRAPKVGGIYKDESESTASLIDVDSPHVNIVDSDFPEKDIQTTTQAERIEREAAEAEQRRVREAAGKKAKAKGKGVGANASNPVYITNAVIGALVGAGLGFGAYRKHAEGKLSWELVGLVSGAVGTFAVADWFVSKWFLQNKYPLK
ncbi:uncharacterized protein N7483_001563 [Penicillium malachiteum]|uniref:uncharacterized protein n=1 Tax=Penicillium malachiteum TaxID=1324776 RepID=UPI0025493576|nr:uncharacterized protein N7483_001563 [Penicillium malachiteum]KAJ5736438.1 hypothetical protein N7483_001563 [Penicillium malachiteum]